MDAIEDTLAALRAKHEKELAEVQRQHAMQATVARALSLSKEAFRPGWMHAYGADCHVYLAAETLPDAILIAEKMAPLMACIVKDGSTTFLPDARIPEKRRERAKIEPICPYFYEVGGIAGQLEEKTLRFFAQAGAHIVDVRIRVKCDTDTARRYHVEYNKRGDIVKEERSITNNSGHFPNVVRWWSPSGEPGNYTLWSY